VTAIGTAIASHEASNVRASRHPPSSDEAGNRRPVAPPLVPSPLDDEPSGLLAPPDEDELEAELVVPDDDDVDVPPSVVGVVAPVTVIVRVVFATPSFAVPAPLADIAATQSVIVPLVAGAVNENSYVAVAPDGGGVMATTSSGVSTGKGTFVFEPAVTTTPSLNAASNDVRARVPLTTSVTSFFDPACTVVGSVRVIVGTGVLGL
jgi:hypothetical protein